MSVNDYDSHRSEWSLKVTPGQPYDDFGNWTVECTGVDASSDVMGCEG